MQCSVQHACFSVWEAFLTIFDNFDHFCSCFRLHPLAAAPRHVHSAAGRPVLGPRMLPLCSCPVGSSPEPHHPRYCPWAEASIVMISSTECRHCPGKWRREPYACMHACMLVHVVCGHCRRSCNWRQDEHPRDDAFAHKLSSARKAFDRHRSGDTIRTSELPALWLTYPLVLLSAIPSAT